MKYFIIGFILIMTFGCNLNNKSDLSGSSIISGEIVNSGDDFIIYNINKKIRYEDDTAFLNKDRFNINFDINEPVYVEFNVNNVSFPVYIKPNDSLFFALNADDPFKSIRFKDKSLLVYNHYLIEFFKLKQEFASKLAKVYTLNEANVKSVMDSIKNQQLKVLNDLKDGYRGFDKKFFDIEKARINYNWAYNLHVYEKYHTYLTKNREFEVSAGFDSYLSELNINDSTLLELDIYRLFLNTFFNGIISDLYSDKTIREENPSYILFRMMKIGEIFSDKSIRDYMAYTIMLDHVKSQGYNDYNKIENIFKRHCKSNYYLSEIENELSNWDHLRKGMPAKDIEAVDINNNTVNLSDFKGKYIYLDIWATWCTPCIFEIPYLEKLQEEFKNNQIVFISISVDSKKEKWEEMLKERDLGGIQLYAGRNKIIKDFYKVNKIPRFILLDKEMNFISSSVERPSMGVGEIINELEGI